jgi:hypothetical protein
MIDSTIGLAEMVIIALPSQWAVEILASRLGAARLCFNGVLFARSLSSVLFDGVDHRVGSFLEKDPAINNYVRISAT